MEFNACLLIRKAAAALRPMIMLTLIAGPAWVQAQPANYAGNLLSLPRVSAEGLVFQVELKLIENFSPARFELVEAVEAEPGDFLDGFFEDNTLTVVSVDVGGIPHWARMELVSLDPVIFRLLSAGVDDEDDDNDGLMDILDENPWTPELCTNAFCMMEPSSTGPPRQSHYRGFTEDPHAPMVPI